jgi:hypothetical protein
MKSISIFLFIGFAFATISNAQVIPKSNTQDDLWETRSLVMYKVILLPEKDKKEFMKIFGEYNEKLIPINRNMASLIVDYANNYKRMTDQKADEYVNRLFDVKGDTLDLNKKYYRIFKKNFGATTAARFVQTMNIIQHHHDARHVGKMPLVE